MYHGINLFMYHGVSLLLLALSIFGLFVFVFFIIRSVLLRSRNESVDPIAEEETETEESLLAKATGDESSSTKAEDDMKKEKEEDAISAEGINSFMEVAALENETEAAELREQAAKLEKSAAELRVSAIPAKKQIGKHELAERGAHLKQEQLETQILQEKIRRDKLANMAEMEVEIRILNRKIANAKLAPKKRGKFLWLFSV